MREQHLQTEAPKPLRRAQQLINQCSKGLLFSNFLGFGRHILTERVIGGSLVDVHLPPKVVPSAQWASRENGSRCRWRLCSFADTSE